MKDNFTRIATILDRSGSMESVREATISGFNQFIEEQKKLPGEVAVKLVQFDDQYEEVYDLPLKDVPMLTQQSFVPRGWTALLDAQGRTITTLGAELAAMPEEQRPSKVVVMTLTDGHENRSKEFTLDRIAALIKQQKEQYGWEFIFLGANQNAVKVAASMNIPQSAAITYNSNPVAMANVMASANAYVQDFRAKGMAAFSDEDRVNAMVSDEQDDQQKTGAAAKTVVIP